MNTRILVIAALLAFSLLMSAPDLRRPLGHPLGIPGVYFDYNAVVTGVNPREASSGVRVGDRLDLARATFDQRFSYGGIGTPEAGGRIAMPMLRGNRPYVAHLVSLPEWPQRIDMVWLRGGIQVVIAFLGVLVLMRRPSPATWGFFVLMFIGCAPVNDAFLLGPPWWRITAWTFFWLLDVLPQYGALFFALHLLHSGPLPRWRVVAQALSIALAALGAAAALWHAHALWFSSQPDPIVAILYSVLATLPYFLAPVFLIGTYFESAPNLRERLRWIIVGFLAAVICNTADQLGTQGNLGIIQMSYVVHSLLTAGVYLFIGVPVAYAVLKHHIIDVNVAISRATVYTALSVFVVGLFALVDLFFSRVVAQTSAGLMADVALALILGFSFNTLHHHVDGFVDRLLFHKRHLAQQYVAGLAPAMVFAHGQPQVCSMLVNEPVRAFELTGAQIFNDVGRGNNAMQTLAACLESQRTSARLSDGQWDVRSFFSADWTPALAVPVFSHGTLDSIVVYGVHRNGTDLDADEVVLLERLGDAAGAAFDRLEADELRREVSMLRAERGGLLSTTQ